MKIISGETPLTQLHTTDLYVVLAGRPALMFVVPSSKGSLRCMEEKQLIVQCNFALYVSVESRNSVVKPITRNTTTGFL